MLTADTKRHIDSARQVLVGKVPNPISQVQEITNALVYKFMDDMDEQAAALGGKRRYFVGDYEKYSWRKLMSPQVGAQDRLNIYQESLKQMAKNPGIPPLFQQIFSNTYLPYNDGRTLSLFLTEINYFDYKHSEELGNAYEYLLSIMGSQGDAGQFRTPRHIIDFIVKAVNPGKNDKVLDPACGTAGFLISAYKHVLAKHDGKDNTTGNLVNTETPLTADEKRKLYANYTGFDISPEMVRLSQVNMFLHGFISPNILVHDSLSSEDYWHDRYDVILANPPFMSPKGGIVPHNKFSVQSNRAEVLFVDYIKNHLKPSGRAGVIVPEGIIFHSGTAYKQLRKNLVEDGLYAVISLPSGVFNPYSGVKTSILLFNNELAKQKSEIVFIKIENDGFDLGAQRREGTKDDIPLALDILNKWNTGENLENKLAVYVEKNKIAESGNYNLSGDRYRVASDYTNAKWSMMKLEDIFIEIKNGKNVTQIDETGKYRVSRIQTIATGKVDLRKTKYTNDEVNIIDFLQEGDILLSHINSIDHLAKTAIFENTNEKVVHGANLLRLRADRNMIIPKYALYVFKSESFIETARSFAQKAVNQASINSTSIKNLQIPVPPLEIQEQIVAELDGYSNIITGAKQITQNWQPKIDIDPDWEKTELGVVADVVAGQSPEGKFYNDNGEGTPFYQGKTEFGDIYINEPKKWTTQITKIANDGDILMSVRAPVGPVNITRSKICIGRGLASIRAKKIQQTYLFTYLQMIESQIIGNGGAVFDSISKKQIEEIEIPLPPLKIQKQIVEKLESERALIASAKKLTEIYEQKTKATITKLWEE
jgi:type I restriction enzyme M protein